MKGRKKKPEMMLELAGTARKDRPRSSVIGQPVEAVDEIMAMEPVKVLTRKSKRIFKEVAAALVRRRGIESVDVYALVNYATLYARWMEAVEMCEKEPRLMKRYNVNGDMIGFIENPFYRDVVNLPREINAIGSRFGFSPVDRMKLNEAPKDEKKSLAELLEDVDYEES